jgi:hypothetical protein
MNLSNKGQWQTLNLKWWSVLLILFPILLYYTWVCFWGIDCPQLDDFAVLTTIVDINKAITLKEELEIWFTPHNEHRIVFTRLIFWLVGTTDKGAVDIYKVLLIGNLTLVGLASIFIE